MRPTEEDVKKYERAWEEIKKALSGGPISPEKYTELYDKHNLRDLTPRVIGWIGICRHCLEVIQPMQLKDLHEKFNLKKCDEIIEANGKCYILNKKCQSISKDGNKCRESSYKKS